MTIQWFPGHMAKAKREVEENLKLVDLIVELVDARAPFSSQNPMLQEVTDDKQKLVLLMKSDLADSKLTQQWVDYFESEGKYALAIDVNNKEDIKKIIKQTKVISEKINERRKEKGINPRSLRAMILGIPNVGKSTLINRLANKKQAKTGDQPGVTRQQQWIRVHGEFELLDTPGILWPKFEDEEVGYKLAAIGTIKDQILHLDDIAVYILRYFKEHYAEALLERYPTLNIESEDIVEWFDAIGKKRGCLMSGGVIDYDQVADVIIRDLRQGHLGNVTFDQVSL
ncbi:ribosome biogenesis GTPase YlqF [Alkalibacillus haloalkaliphilus]|uniref:ribosome biogenesis GTPase YlqF n=1 Tax=Alkalibacillus haloalkaliphilus TaxID=94136 RepID=UPI002936AD53|nr:ribosome biogenesis GTPase YlqF [Alkalibacillus haloalkaliphilus]MDV2580582.1 ribosome biogenesis GTPase YlqF [Alkalibacillus haloalkaliphilus]